MMVGGEMARAMTEIKPPVEAADTASLPRGRSLGKAPESPGIGRGPGKYGTAESRGRTPSGHVAQMIDAHAKNSGTDVPSVRSIVKDDIKDAGKGVAAWALRKLGADVVTIDKNLPPPARERQIYSALARKAAENLAQEQEEQKNRKK